MAQRRQQDPRRVIIALVFFSLCSLLFVPRLWLFPSLEYHNVDDFHTTIETRVDRFAFVSYLPKHTTDFFQGAAVLAHTLRSEFHSPHQMVLLYHPPIADEHVTHLESFGWQLHPVDPSLAAKAESNKPEVLLTHMVGTIKGGRALVKSTPTTKSQLQVRESWRLTTDRFGWVHLTDDGQSKNLAQISFVVSIQKCTDLHIFVMLSGKGSQTTSKATVELTTQPGQEVQRTVVEVDYTHSEQAPTWVYVGVVPCTPRLVVTIPSKGTHGEFRVYGLRISTSARLGTSCPIHGDAVAKASLWSLTQFTKLVFMDINMHVAQDPEHLFARPGHPLTASHRPVPSTWFSSGLMVISPNPKVTRGILDGYARLGTPGFDCSVDSLLNMHFPDWQHSSIEHRLDSRYIGHSFFARAGDVAGFIYSWTGLKKPLMCFAYGNVSTGVWPWEVKTNKPVTKEIFASLRAKKREIDQLTPAQLAERFGHGNKTIASSQAESVKRMPPLNPMHPQRPPVHELFPNSERDPPRLAFATFIETADSFFSQATDVLIAGIREYVDESIPVIAAVSPDINPAFVERMELAGYTVRRVEAVPMPLEECKDSKWTEKSTSVWGKMRVFEMEEFDKIVYLDLDILVMDDPKQLLEFPGYPISAASGMFPPDHFNSGVMVLRPSKALFRHMMASFKELKSFDCGDQGFLNNYFSDWYELWSTNLIPKEFNLHTRSISYMRSNMANSMVLSLRPKLVHVSGWKKLESMNTILNGVLLRSLFDRQGKQSRTRRWSTLRNRRIAALQSLHAVISTTLERLLPKAHVPIVLVDLPPVQSGVDMLSALGFHSVLRTRGLEVTYQCSLEESFGAENCDVAQVLAAAGTSGVIFIMPHVSSVVSQSSGNSFFATTARRRLVEALITQARNRIVVLPANFGAQCSGNLESISHIVNLHGNIDVMLSDARSAECCRGVLHGAECHLVPDLAFILPPPTNDEIVSPTTDHVWLTSSQQAATANLAGRSAGNMFHVSLFAPSVFMDPNHSTYEGIAKFRLAEGYKQLGLGRVNIVQDIGTFALNFVLAKPFVVLDESQIQQSWLSFVPNQAMGVLFTHTAKDAISMVEQIQTHFM